MLLHDKIESCAHVQKMLQVKLFYLPSITVLPNDCVMSSFYLTWRAVWSSGLLPHNF